MKKFKVFIALFLSVGLVSCGRAYFPIELKTVSRAERNKNQELPEIQIIPLTTEAINKANKVPYKRRVIDAGDLKKPAKILSADRALIEKFPSSNDPGPYKIGVGDVIAYGQVTIDDKGAKSIFSTSSTVQPNGSINLIEVGRINVLGLTQFQLEDLIFKKLTDVGGNRNFEIYITGFNSKKVLVVSEGLLLKTIPYKSNAMFIEDAIVGLNLKITQGSDIKIILVRDGQEFVFSLSNILKSPKAKYRLFPGDKIIVETLNYRAETVLVVGETGAQMSLSINAISRPTLSETLFSGSVLRGETSDFSQIYIIRKNKNSFNAYHLDITNPARISFASKFEMRPDDIIFVATQPLSLYSRTLSQILGSTGLTLQARDTIRSEIGN